MEPSHAVARTKSFLGVEMEIGQDVLVPREETELLGRAACEILRQRGNRGTVVDMCCGAGNLACALATAFPETKILASDLTSGAVAAASANVVRLGLTNRITVRQGDLFAAIAPDLAKGEADLIVCNPPYISTGRLAAEKAYLLAAEPREAFDGGPYGLSVHQRVIQEGLSFLKPDGWLAMEFGEGQHLQIATLFRRARGYEAPDFLCDGHAIPRVVRARRRAEMS